MPILNMEGPYPLNEESIDTNVNTKATGNYTLGVFEGTLFRVRYVGRSDTDLNRRLNEHLGEPYTHFMRSYPSAAVYAYEKECLNFHDFGGSERLHNKIHPDKPEGYPHLKCPRCGL